MAVWRYLGRSVAFEVSHVITGIGVYRYTARLLHVSEMQHIEMHVMYTCPHINDYYDIPVINTDWLPENQYRC